MIWSPQRKFCFVHIPKTGGESVSIAYEPWMHFDDIVLGGKVAKPALMDFYNHTYSLHKHVTAREIARVSGRDRFDEMLSFSVVRDPLDRMMSLYRYLRKGFSVTKKITHPQQQIALDFDFNIFAEKTANNVGRQVDFITDDNDIIVKNVVHIRDIASGWARVQAAIGIQAPLPWHNKSSDEQVEASLETRELIKARFRADYELIAGLT